MTYDIEQIKDMIPIYLNGRLSPDELEAFEAARKKYPELEEELQAFSAIHDSYTRREDKAPVDSDALFARIQSNIGKAQSQNHQEARQGVFQELVQQLRQFFSALYHMPGVSWSLAGAQLAVILALLVIMPGKSDFKTLTDTPAADRLGIRINVAFVQEAREIQIRELLQAMSATIVNGPDAGGFYVLEIDKGPDVEARILKLRSADIVRFAEKELSGVNQTDEKTIEADLRYGSDFRWDAV